MTRYKHKVTQNPSGEKEITWTRVVNEAGNLVLKANGRAVLWFDTEGRLFFGDKMVVSCPMYVSNQSSMNAVGIYLREGAL